MIKQKEIERQTFYNRKEHNGYIMILVDNKYILEHRYLMELYLGRNLKKEEDVHHINFNKLDNRISNLILFPTRKQHARFHRQIKQFGITQPRLTELELLKAEMEKEQYRNKQIINIYETS